MKMNDLAATLLVAVGMSSALALAVPASADPTDDQRAQQTDRVFLDAVNDRGLRLESDDFALELAHSTCDVLTRTGSVDKTLHHIKDATDWTTLEDIRTFGGLAVQGYCPTSMPTS